MNTTDLQLGATLLRKGEILRLQHVLGNRVEILCGSAWLTIDGDPHDLVLESGEGFTVDRVGNMLISALRDTQLVMLAALPRPVR